MEAYDSIIQGSVARFLIDGNEEDAANILLSCALEIEDSGDSWWQGDEQIWAVHVKLTGPRAAYELLSKSSDPVTPPFGKPFRRSCHPIAI